MEIPPRDQRGGLLGPDATVTTGDDIQRIRVGPVLEGVAADRRVPGVLRRYCPEHAAEIVQVGSDEAAFEFDANVPRQIALQQQHLQIAVEHPQFPLDDFTRTADRLPVRERVGRGEIVVHHHVPYEAVLVGFDLVLQFPDRTVAVRGIHRHGFDDDLRQHFRDLLLRTMGEGHGFSHFPRLVVRSRRGNFPVQDFPQQFRDVPFLEGRVQRQDAVENRAQRINVRPLVDLAIVPDLLRGHESGGSQHRPADGFEAGVRRIDMNGVQGPPGNFNPGLVAFHTLRDFQIRSVGLRRHAGWRFARQHLGQPPVEHEYFAVLSDHDIGRLEIPVDHPVGVCECDRVAGFLKNRQESSQRILLDEFRLAAADFIQDIPERHALHILHRIKGVAAYVLAQFVNRHDIRMLQLRRDLRLADKTLPVFRIEPTARQQDLQRNHPFAMNVPRLVYDAHPALGHDAFHVVLPTADHFDGLRGKIVGGHRLKNRLIVVGNQHQHRRVVDAVIQQSRIRNLLAERRLRRIVHRTPYPPVYLASTPGFSRCIDEIP